MNNAAIKSDGLMFGELLHYLRQHGFVIGVDQYLRLQRLLDKISGCCAPGELRTLLCPIFATSKIQQEQFYRAFDSYFDLFHIAYEQDEAEQESPNETHAPARRTLAPQAARRKWLYVAAPAALIMFIAAFALFLRTKPGEQPSVNQASAETLPDTTVSPEPATTASQEASEVATETDAPQPVKEESPAPVSPQTETWATAPSFYERHRTGIHLAIILSPLVLFLLYEWYRFARRKLMLQKQPARKPPFAWPIRVDAPRDGLYESEQFLAVTRAMRRRQVDEFRRLDVEATIAATIERLGFPDFRYKPDSRVTEYLFLIDRASYRDHQAHLYDELARTLEREGVFVVRFFFDGDPRICRDESSVDVLPLAELQNRFGSHRLIIFGSGEKLLDQITGRLDGWTAIFNHWQDRAVLTPQSPEQWGLREIAVAQLFILLPATLNGLLALIDHFETTLLANPLSSSHARFFEPSRQATPEETVAELRGSLGEDLFQWLAACAVYTELHWDLTLHIGSLPAMPRGLVTETHLLKLIRLPWFRTGAIPDELRWLLIKELAPERQQAVRAAVIELLERDPAPPETFAGDQYRLNLFAQRWLHSQTRKRLRELLEVMKRLPRSQVVRDLTLIRFLESSKRSPLDFLLPDRLRKLFYHKGISAFGLKTGARLLITLLVMGIAWAGIKAFNPIKPTVISDQGQTTQIADVVSNPASPPTLPLPAQEQNQNSNNMSEALPSVADNRKQIPPGDISGQKTDAARPVEVTKEAGSAPIPMPGTLIGSGTEKGVTSIPGIGDITQPTRQTPIQDEEPPPPLPAQTPTPKPPPNVVSGGALNSKAISLPKPVYPPDAVNARASGKVVVQVMVDESGKVISASAIKGNPLLHQAAVNAAFRARFPQTIISGQPVKVSGVLNYNFEIKEPVGTDIRTQGEPGRRPPARPGGRQP